MSAPKTAFGYQPPIRSFEPVQCFRVEAVRGEGIVGDPVRVTVSWFTATGELIAYRDDWANEPKDTP